MKTRMISLRLDAETAEKLEQDLKRADISISEYVRNLINEHTPEQRVGSEKLMESICNIYNVINRSECKENEELMEEMNKLCLILL